MRAALPIATALLCFSCRGMEPTQKGYPQVMLESLLMSHVCHNHGLGQEAVLFTSSVPGNLIGFKYSIIGVKQSISDLDLLLQLFPDIDEALATQVVERGSGLTELMGLLSSRFPDQYIPYPDDARIRQLISEQKALVTVLNYGQIDGRILMHYRLISQQTGIITFLTEWVWDDQAHWAPGLEYSFRSTG